ncbi:MAG: hypothetical protein K8R41_00525 [Bacteroidales bacterium]|nr:hypothetical protein [Bacteroidales bacterium]
MEILEILEKIEEIIKSRDSKLSEEKIETELENESESHPKKNIIKDIFYLVLSFILNILKAPFKLIAKYIKDEIFAVIKKDAKLYMFILFFLRVLLMFSSVLWFFISVAVGVYFYEKGHSILISIIYSIGFQLISFIIISLIIYIASRKIKSFKMMKNMSMRKK